jgi:hypothetical protein
MFWWGLVVRACARARVGARATKCWMMGARGRIHLLLEAMRAVVEAATPM